MKIPATMRKKVAVIRKLNAEVVRGTDAAMFDSSLDSNGARRDEVEKVYANNILTIISTVCDHSCSHADPGRVVLRRRR